MHVLRVSNRTQKQPAKPKRKRKPRALLAAAESGVKAAQKTFAKVLGKADPKRYETLPFNESSLLHTLVVHATIAAGTGVAPFLGDIGLAGSRVVRQTGSDRAVRFDAKIEELGDLRVFGALETIDATGLTAAPVWDKTLKVGDEVALPQGPSKGPVIATGQPAAVVLLRPLADGRYQVERIVSVQ